MQGSTPLERIRNAFSEYYTIDRELGRLGDEEDAVYEYRKGAELAPSEPSFHLSLGQSLELLNRPEEAMKSYEQYLALSPPSPEADKVKARLEQLRKPV